MKNKVTLAAAVFVAFVAGLSVGAVQEGNRTYYEATQFVQGEWAAMQVKQAEGDLAAVKRAEKRADHWIEIMEQLKP